MKKITLFLFLGIVTIVCFLYMVNRYSSRTVSRISAINSVADISGDKPVSLVDLSADYGSHTDKLQEGVHILIVPGHEPNFGGAQFGSIYERNLVVELGQDLQQFLQTNPGYKVSITRNTQSWDPIFASYFKSDWNNIIAWEKTSKKNASELTPLGISSAPTVIHNSAPTYVALRLYGITKWANENSVDLMIHLHLSDYPGHSKKFAGKYSGLVIYTPAQQYGNSSTTKAIADAVFKRLSIYNPTSNLPVESSGIIDDPELIAVGANNTSDAASMLIEYDYLYQPQFVNPKVRSLALKDLAYQTYLGLQDFFTKKSNVTAISSYDPKVLYSWNTPVVNSNSNPEDIYALQTALIMDGDFPPVGKSKNECPHSGTLGSCTRIALQAFQKKNSITGESIEGKKTFNMLNNIYSGKIN